MIRFGQVYNQFNNQTIGIKRFTGNKTEENAVDTPAGTPVKSQSIKYGSATLAAHGITDMNIINRYFDNAGTIISFNGTSEQCYTLKNNIVIDGKPITNLKELVEALSGTSALSNGVTLAEYAVKIGDTGTFADTANYLAGYQLVFGTDNSQAREDDENRDTRTIYYIAGLRAYGITNANIINTYFDTRETDISMVKPGITRDSVGYSLKNDIVIDGKAITTIQELVKALGIESSR